MARPRTFNKEEIIEKAMQCFWLHGYENASITELEEATGIKRISLYNSFGDKEGLFIATQKLYLKQNQDYFNRCFSGDKIQTLIDFFNGIANQRVSSSSPFKGCMMANTTLDFHNVSNNIIDNVKEFRWAIGRILITYLNRCKNSEQIKENLDLEACSEFILGNMWGASSSTKLYQDTKHTKKHLSVVLDVIEGWKKNE